MKRLFFVFLTLSIILCGCSGNSPDRNLRTVRTAISKPLATLDPALAADTACQSMAAAFYDTPLQYSFLARPFRLEPSMLARMPEFSSDGRTVTCVLRNDLLFQKNPCFRNDSERRVTARDAVFSILRLADARLGSSGYWLIRGRVAGIEQFRERTANAAPGDFSPYDSGCPGLEAVDALTFRIHLNEPDPRFIYALAMPYFAVVPRRAVEYWQDRFPDHPAGSGPFLLAEWAKDHHLELRRNPEYRKEFFRGAETPDDRTRPLPLADRIVCYLVKQPTAGWLMFLQGELDYFALDGENFAAVVNSKQELAPCLKKRGISLLRSPECQTVYIGFNFADPLLGKNENLRRAVSLAFDRQKRVELTAGRIVPAYGPVPPGTAGFLASPGPFGVRNIPLAKEYMRKAGFPDGIDPATGRRLELAFDQANSDSFCRQTAELMALDLAEIGITVRPEFNNRARFLQKLASGQTQLFRFSWTGDYPDAENFLQLFYGPNAGSCNRVRCSFPEFDREFASLRTKAPSPALAREYERLAGMVRLRCPWIFESCTVSFLLKHAWTENCRQNDFAFNRWKYMTVDPGIRETNTRGFTPLSLRELRGDN